MPVKPSFVIGAIGNVTSCALYASPIPTFCTIRKKKSTEMFSVLPYISTLLTTLFGMYYGATKSSGGMLIMSINTIGFTFEMAYILMFIVYGSKAMREKIWKLLLAEVLFFGTVVVITHFFMKGNTRTLTIGCISAAVGLTMYVAPLSVIKTVIRTKNVEPLPLALNIFLLVNGLIWSAFAFFAKDIFVGVPSVVGCLFTVAQIGIYIYFRSCAKQQQQKAADEKPSEQKHQVIELNDLEEGKVSKNGSLKESDLVKTASNKLKVESDLHKTASNKLKESDLAIVRTASNKLKQSDFTIVRTASNKLVEMLMELPTNGVTAYRTASGKIFKDNLYQYVEVAKQQAV